MRLLKYYYGPEVSQIKLETGAFIPTRKGVTSEKLEPFTKMMPQYYARITKICYVIDGVLEASVFNDPQRGPAGHRPRHEDPGAGCRGDAEGTGRR